MTFQDLSNNYSIKWSTSVNDITLSDWEDIFGKSIIKSQRFFISIEKSDFQQITIYYLQIFEHGTVVAIVPCFSYEIDILNLTTSPMVKAVVKKIRKVYIDFFKIRAFVTGTYASSCEHFIEYKTTLSAEKRQIVFDLVRKQLKNKCRQTKSKFVFIKDIRGRNIDSIKKILGHDFYFFSSFPTNVIPVLSSHKYPEMLKSKYRKRFQDSQKAFNENFMWDISTDFANQTLLFTELYNNVLNKAENKFEFLNVTFFENLNMLFSSKSFLLIAKDKLGEVRLMTLILEDAKSLIPLYMGIKYKTDDTRVLYITALGRMVEEAEIRHKDYVDLGQTSYYPKVLSGAFVEDIYYGFWSNHYLLKWLIKNVFPRIFIRQHIPGNVYLEDNKSLNAYMIFVENFKRMIGMKSCKGEVLQ